MPRYCDLTDLPNISNASSRFAKIPQFLKELVQRAVAEVNPQKIFVFGSRVRGDFHDTSDIDIAFLLDEASSSWARFATNEPERIQTLLNVDLVNLNEAGQGLQDYILDKGVIIYDRTVKI